MSSEALKKYKARETDEFGYARMLRSEAEEIASREAKRKELEIERLRIEQAGRNSLASRLGNFGHLIIKKAARHT